MQRDSGMSLDHPQYNCRLIAATIDKIARDSPTRIYASVPISNTELSRGFRDITYAELAAAVDRTAYWLDEHLPAPTSPPTSTSSHFSSSSSDPDGDDASATSGIQTFAYYGPRDLRYIAFMCAAMKTGRRLLLTSILGSLEAQVYLAKAANCHLFLYAEGGADVVPHHVREIPKSVDGGISFAVPEFEDLFFGNEGDEQRRYPYEKTWEEGRFDEIAIYHTSGSSGFPKLVIYTNEMLARVDSWNWLKDVDGMTTSKEYYADKRMWVGLPIFHLAGSLLTLSCALFFSTTPVLSPPTAIPDPSLFAQMATHARLDGMLLSPSCLEDIVRAPSLHALLRRLRAVCFGGAPLSPAAGAFLAPLGSLRTCIGSTEGNYWPTLRVPAADWAYLAPHPAMGAAFEHRVDDLYELVVRRTPDALAFTNFFQAADKMVVRGAAGAARERVDVFRTKDLWSPHPDPEKMKMGVGLWKCRGRTDDLVVLTGEVKMYAGNVEERLKCHPLVRHVLVGGYMRRVPFLLLEAVDGVAVGTAAERETFLDGVWPAVEEVNVDVGERGRLRRALTLVAVPEKPFARVGKGTVDRRGTYTRYEKETDELYQRFHKDDPDGLAS